MNRASTTKTLLAGLMLATSLAPSTRAGDKMMYADLFDDGDSLWVVDLDDMAGAHKILDTPANFVRGLVVDGQDSGWFIASYTESTTPTGLFRFANGTLTHVAPFPLIPTGSLADATLAPGGGFIYYVFDPAGAQDTTLYRVDFDGTFTQLAVLTDAHEPHPWVPGIAIDRVTGVLYGYEMHHTAHLTTIDPATGVMTFVGNSGLPAYPQQVIMSMDFTLSNQLVLTQNFGQLFHIDTATGLASPSFAELPAATGAIAFLPAMESAGTPFCLGDGTDPLLTRMCPCANFGSAGSGCDNSASTGGALLVSAGTASPDTLVLKCSGELSSSLSIFVQGDATVASGVVFGDGIRCVSGSLVRIGTKHAVGGVARYPQIGDPSISTQSSLLGDPIAPGSTRYYQTYYRDPSPSFCPRPAGNSFNVSNGMAVTW